MLQVMDATRSMRILLAGAVAAAAALALQPAQAVAQEDMNLRVGYQYTLWGLPAVIALEKKLFEKHGLKVDARRFGAGRDAMEGIIAGSVDVSTTGGTPFIIGAATGQIQAIGTVGYMGGTGCLMAGNKTGITKVTDFKGKRIASRKGTTIDNAVVNLMLPAHGLTPGSDVTLVNVNFPDMVAALAAGSVEGFAGVEPSCAIAEHQGIAVKVESAEKYDMLANMYIAQTGWAEKNPKKAEAFMMAVKEASDIIQNKPDEARAIVSELYKDYNLDPQVVLAIIKVVDADLRYRDGLDKYFQDQLAELYKKGNVKVGTLDWGKVLYSGTLKKLGLGGS